MPAIATASNLSHHFKLRISHYRELLTQQKAESMQVGYEHRGKSYSYSIKLSRTACNYGGHRHWWLCPKCSKRVSVLYCAGAYVCRHCIGGKYGSQLEQPIDNLFRRLDRIRTRLGWQDGVIHGIGERPKGMHRSTYSKLVNEYDKLTSQLWQSTLDQLGCTR